MGNTPEQLDNPEKLDNPEERDDPDALGHLDNLELGAGMPDFEKNMSQQNTDPNTKTGYLSSLSTLR